MREHVTHKTNPTQQILVRKLFPTFFDTYMTYQPSFVLFCENTGSVKFKLQSPHLTSGIRFFFFAYCESIINNAEAFFILILWFNPLYLPEFHVN